MPTYFNWKFLITRGLVLPVSIFDWVFVLVITRFEIGNWRSYVVYL